VEVDGERVGPAVLGFAQYLYQLPLGVFGIALATAIFPVLSRKSSQEDHAGLVEVFARGLRLSVFVALPASVGLVLVARPLVAALLEYGQFESKNTARVSGALVFYSLGMVAYFAQHIVVRTFYALQDSRTPARVAMWMVLLNFALNLSLVFVLEERGLALATAICAFVQVTILLIVLSRRLHALTTGTAAIWTAIGAGVARSAVATTVMGAVIALLRVSSLSSCGPIVETLVLVLVGVLVYGGAATALRVNELFLLFRRGL
jgi:putative peptidoglycan lipid II flippase